MAFVPGGMYSDQTFLPETMLVYCLFERNYVQEISEYARCLWLGAPAHFLYIVVTIKKSTPQLLS